MDRNIVYPASIPQEVDILNINKNAMIGLSKLAAAVMGTSTLLNGLACTPNSPAALNVLVGAGEIYSLANIDGTAYGSLAADTTHSILKQGISLDTVTLSCPAPSTSGYSVNYLVQVAYQDVDANPVVLPYYNASNPAQAYSGPNNSGVAQNTARKGVCTVAVKAGVAATTGTQTTPAPDAGYIGAYVVTVANGQTTVTSGNISTYAGAPFIPYTLTQLAPLASPPFTGSPTAPTAAQFDNTTKLSTTSFVQRALGNFAGVRRVSVNTTLTAADVGKTIFVDTANVVVTIPLASSISDGSAIFIQAGAANVTVQRQGADSIGGMPSTTSCTLAYGDNVWLRSDNSIAATWLAIAGTPVLAVMSSFASSLGNTGYQKLPSGFIIQWGMVTTSASADVLVTFPIAFPTSCKSVVAMPAGTSFASYNSLTNSNFNLDSYNTSGARVSASVPYIAIGY